MSKDRSWSPVQGKGCKWVNTNKVSGRVNGMIEWSGVDVQRQVESGVGSEDDMKGMSK